MIAILDNIRSCENVGSILRAADCLGIKEVWLLGITPGPENKNVRKASLGGEKNLNILELKNFTELSGLLKKKNLGLYSIEINKHSTPLNKFKPPIEDYALVFGNEVSGVDERILKISKDIISIPMIGTKESLNVAVCFGIVAYVIEYF